MFVGRSLVGLAGALALLISSTARANVNTMAIIVEGSAALPWLDLAQSRAEAVSGRLGRPVVSSKGLLLPRGQQSFKACVQESFETCGRQLVKKLSPPVKHILLFTVAEDAQNAANVVVTGWLIDGQTGTTVISEQRFCERCTNPSFEASVDEVTTQVLRGGGSGLTTKVRVESVPAGAEVQLDNVLIGVTPLEVSTSPGLHSLTLRKAGYKLAVRQVDAANDETKQVTVTLEPESRNGMSLAPWKWVSLGAGVALLAWGGVELARYEAEVKDGDRQPRYRDTRLTGGLLLGGGVLLVGTSVVLFVLDARRSVVPGVALGDGGASFTLSGRF